jgi:hypothetical protein
VKQKRFIVVPRTESAKEKGITTGKGKLTFGGKTAAWVDDPAVAREIDAQHGLKGSGDVWVEQDENLEWHEKNDGETDGRKLGTHHYAFTVPDISHIKTTRDNGFVWVRKGGSQVRVKRDVALAEGWQIVKQKRRKVQQ